MPLLPTPSYRPPLYLFNGHVQTIIPSMYRKVDDVKYRRERMSTLDGDFLDLDWLQSGSDRLVILTHGLEGNSDRAYMKGAAQALQNAGWDVLAWNCRTCSEEMNLLPRMYGHGEIGDLDELIQNVRKSGKYTKIALAGFSMGGSIILKYLGVHGSNLPKEIIGGVAISTPCHLETCSERLDWGLNRIYRKRFLDQLIPKIIAKEKQFPGLFDLAKIKDIKKMRDFDEHFSAPANGLSTADEFYKYGSSIYYMEGIRVPTLLLNAQNDPILSPLSYPREIAADSAHVFLETPKQGGHVGFSLNAKIPWHEIRVCEFLGSIA